MNGLLPVAYVVSWRHDALRWIENVRAVVTVAWCLLGRPLLMLFMASLPWWFIGWP